MPGHNVQSSTLESAIKDPSDVFEGPEQIIHDPRFSTTDKLRILERWKTDAELLQVATEENMVGENREDGSLLQRVNRSVDRLAEHMKLSRSAAKSGNCR